MRRAPQHSAGITSLAVGKADPKLLQDFLAAKLSLSRRTAKAVIDGRSVWVNRKCVWIARYELNTGDQVEIPAAVVKGAKAQGTRDEGRGMRDEGRGITQTPKNPKTQTPQKASRHVRVLWQNDSYLVCDKPAGFVSCDDPKSVEAILRVQESIPTLEAVHRLDRDTTGCLMFAKNHAAYLAAVEVFKTRNVKKVYHAIAVGKMEYAHTSVNAELDGKDAITRIVRETACDDASFLRVRIETGRTNQIRRHLASIRHPVVGDRVFGLKSAKDARLMSVPRQMLHASGLSMPNPLVPRKEISVHSPLPADFRATLRLFGL